MLSRKVNNDYINFKLDDIININKLKYFNFNYDVFINGLNNNYNANIKLILLILLS